MQIAIIKLFSYKIKSFYGIFMFCLCGLVVAVDSQAKTDREILLDWTKQNEAYLLDQHGLIRSEWFESACMDMAQKMSFNNISQCRLLDSSHINAYVLNNGHVYFSLALMQQIRNQHQWASILAHENAHIELNHYLKNLKKLKSPGVFFPKAAIKRTMKKHEMEADQWSHEKLESFGYDADQIHFFLQRVKKIKKNKKRSTHIKLSKRIKKTNDPEIIDITLMEKISSIQ